MEIDTSAKLEIQHENIEYYNWSDIESFLCIHMNIHSSMFRKYFSEGHYHNFWYVWLSIVQDDIDDYTNRYWFSSILETEHDMKNEYGEWAGLLFHGLRKLQEKVNSESITIRYNW